MSRTVSQHEPAKPSWPVAALRMLWAWPGMFPAVLSVVFLSAGVGLQGCSPQSGPISPICTNSVECGQDGICHQGGCMDMPLAQPGSAASWVAELAPDPATGLPTEELSALAVDSEGATVLQPHAAVRLSGRVILGDLVEESVAAEVVAVRSSAIPGRPSIYAQAEAMAGVPSDGEAFSLLLAPGHAYEVRVSPLPPLDQAIPPLTETIEITGDVVRDFVLLSPGNTIRAHGQIFDSTGKALGNLRVRGLLADGQQVSSLAYTDDEDSTGKVRGLFEIFFPPRERAYYLEVSPTSQAPDYPTVLFPVDVPAAGEANLGRLMLPPFEGTRIFLFRIRGQGSSGISAGVLGATLRMTTSVETGREEATYVREGMTNDVDGQVALVLIPGAKGGSRSYRMTVIPPVGAEVQGIYDRPIEIESAPPANPTTIDLPLRPAVSGLVTTAGKGLENVMVSASLSTSHLAALPRDTADAQRRVPPPSTTTDASGRFVLRLDGDARYDLLFVPPAGSPYPVWSQTDVAVSGSTPLTVFEAPAGALLRALLKLPSGEPLVGAVVRLYETASAGGCDAQTPGSRSVTCTPARLLAQGRPGATGEARLIVPAATPAVVP